MTQETKAEERPTVDVSLMARGAEVRPLELEDIATIKEEGDPRLIQIMRDYLANFCAPIRETRQSNGEEIHEEFCPACGEKFSGLLASLGFGVGIEWGIAHGEGHCSGCGWPYRALHRIYDPEEWQSYEAAPDDAKAPEPLATISNMFLAYHPSRIGGWTPPKKDN